jgi:predicted GNAT family acetyltransferase
VRVRRVDDPSEFLTRTQPLLLADEARHNLILGLAGNLSADPELYPNRSLWLVEHSGAVVAAALRTPPFKLVLARPAVDDAIGALVADIDDDLPGVVAALPEGHDFTAAWCARTGAREVSRRGQGIYALDRVPAVPAAHGAPRRATGADRGVLRTWLRDFSREALGEDPDPGQLEHQIEHRLRASDGALVFWEVAEEPVSLAGFGSPTPNGIRIGPVYTPPELRGRGYASGLVATVSAEQLTSGRRFCFLYTDLANPISNRLYERMGYERVCESAEIAFAR